MAIWRYAFDLETGRPLTPLLQEALRADPGIGHFIPKAAHQDELPARPALIVATGSFFHRIGLHWARQQPPSRIRFPRMTRWKKRSTASRKSR